MAGILSNAISQLLGFGLGQADEWIGRKVAKGQMEEAIMGINQSADQIEQNLAQELIRLGVPQEEIANYVPELQPSEVPQVLQTGMTLQRDAILDMKRRMAELQGANVNVQTNALNQSLIDGGGTLGQITGSSVDPTQVTGVGEGRFQKKAGEYDRRAEQSQNFALDRMKQSAAYQQAAQAQAHANAMKRLKFSKGEDGESAWNKEELIRARQLAAGSAKERAAMNQNKLTGRPETPWGYEGRIMSAQERAVQKGLPPEEAYAFQGRITSKMVQLQKSYSPNEQAQIREAIEADIEAMNNYGNTSQGAMDSPMNEATEITPNTGTSNLDAETTGLNVIDTPGVGDDSMALQELSPEYVEQNEELVQMITEKSGGQRPTTIGQLEKQVRTLPAESQQEVGNLLRQMERQADEKAKEKMRNNPALKKIYQALKGK